MQCYALVVFIGILCQVSWGFKIYGSRRSAGNVFKMASEDKLCVMVNGMPGPMATEVAKVCLDRDIALSTSGFTGPSTVQQGFVVESVGKTQHVDLVAGPGINSQATSVLLDLKSKYKKLIVVDYTHPSAVLNNVKAYVEANVDFIMGTTGFDPKEVQEIFNKGQNYAIIAPNMAKQIVALQSALLQTAQRFPGSFQGYQLKVRESHQSSKADTSGTAKAIVSHLSDLTGDPFKVEEIKKIREKDQQLAFGVPGDSLGGHAFHTYTLESSDGSVSFELKHNVCGRRIYAEGTVDALEFLDQLRSNKPSKRLYNMIDVLEAGQLK